MDRIKIPQYPKEHQGSQPKGETKLNLSRGHRALERGTNEDITGEMRGPNHSSLGIRVGTLGSRDPHMRLFNPSTWFNSPEPLSTCPFPFPFLQLWSSGPTGTGLETQEEDLATRVTLTPSQGYRSLSFPSPKAHATSEATGLPSRRETLCVPPSPASRSQAPGP